MVSLPNHETSSEFRFDELVDEITRKLQAGEKVDLDSYLQKLPAFSDRLRQIWPGLLALAELGCSNDPGDLSVGNSSEISKHLPNGTLGDFRLLQEIGRGGMGVVYEAEQISLDRRVALKVLPMAGMLDPRQLRRFQNEAKAAAGLHHPNIVPVHSVGCDRGMHYYAMQFIEGRSLGEVIAELKNEDLAPLSKDVNRLVSRVIDSLTNENPLEVANTHNYQPDPGETSDSENFEEAQPVPDQPTTKAAGSLSTQSPAGSANHAHRNKEYLRNIAQLGIQIAEALDYSHSLGITHRDIKPGNLLVDARGNVWVADFGLAQVGTEGNLTLTGEMLGTLRYMSPEQASGYRGVLDHRTDVYSLGVTLYELLTLKPAFPATDRRELLNQVLNDDPRLPRQINPAIPLDLETIVLKAIAKNPQSRYQSAQELAADLKRFLENRPIQARRPSFYERFLKFTKRHKTAVVSTAIGLLLPLAAIGALWVSTAREREAKQRQLMSDVNQALEEATFLRGKAEQAKDDVGKWYAALSVAQRAASLVEGSVDLTQQQRVATLVKDLEKERNAAQLREEQAQLDRWMVNELEQIQIEQSNVSKVGRFDYESSLPKYLAAFQKYGIDIENLQPEEIARRIRSRQIRSELVGALDDWARHTENEEPRRQQLLTIAQLADSKDTIRQRLRDFLRGAHNSRIMESLDPKVLALQPPQTILMAVNILEKKGRRTEALDLLRAAQFRYPNDFWINLKLGGTVQELVDSPLLAAQFRYPNDSWVDFKLGGTVREGGLVGENTSTLTEDEALRCLTVAVALRPQSAAAWLHLGRSLSNMGRIDAVNAFHEAIRLKPDFAEAYSNLGNVLFAQGRRKEAIEAYHEAIRIEPNHAQAHYNLGNGLVKMGQTKDAVQPLREAIRLKPDYARAYQNLGVALLELGDFENSINANREAIRLKPDYALAHFSLGNAFEEVGSLKEATEAYREAIRLQPDLAAAHFNLGNALGTLGETNKAIEAYREAIRLNPDLAEAHDGLGIVLENSGLLKEATVAYREAIRLKPDYFGAHMNVGNVLFEQGRRKEAIEAYYEAIRIKPDFAEAHFNLGKSLLLMGQTEDAIQPLREAIRLKPDFAQAYSILGTALSQLGDFENAINVIREAIRLKPDDVMAHRNLGVILKRVGRLQEALAGYLELIRLKPDSPDGYIMAGSVLQLQGKWTEALPLFKRVHELGKNQANWRHPSAQWVKQCEQLIALDQKLAELLNGQYVPTQTSEWVQLAVFCQKAKKKHYAYAVQFYEQAFRLQPELNTRHRYNAACAALLAISEALKGEQTLDDKKKAAFRQKALNWLRAELVDLKAIGLSEKQIPSIAKYLQHWKEDPDLAGARGEESINALPEIEQADWRALWKDVDELLNASDASPDGKNGEKPAVAEKQRLAR